MCEKHDITEPSYLTLRRGLRYLLTLLLMTGAGFRATSGSQHTLDDIEALPRHISGYETFGTVEQRMARGPLHGIEGIWQLTGDGGSIIAIERIEEGETIESAASVYRIVVITSSEISVRPGTVIGYAATSAKSNEYDSRIFTDRSEDFVYLTRPSRNLLKLDETGTRLSFTPVGLKLRFNWWRLLLPYLYRSVITPLEGGKVEDGCVRIYPEPVPPVEPRYL